MNKKLYERRPSLLDEMDDIVKQAETENRADTNLTKMMFKAAL